MSVNFGIVASVTWERRAAFNPTDGRVYPRRLNGREPDFKGAVAAGLECPYAEIAVDRNPTHGGRAGFASLAEIDPGDS